MQNYSIIILSIKDKKSEKAYFSSCFLFKSIDAKKKVIAKKENIQKVKIL